MLCKLEGVPVSDHLWLDLFGEGRMMLENTKLPKEPSETSLTTPSDTKCIKAYIWRKEIILKEYSTKKDYIDLKKNN